MSVNLLKRSQVGMCLLCHDAPCTQACKGLDPARILRAIRFDNPYAGLALLPEQDTCADCEGRCMKVCPAQVNIPSVMGMLRESTAGMERTTHEEQIDLSCDICGVPLENPFLLSSSVVGSNEEMCARAFDMGWAGVAFKTICLMEIHEASPRFSALKERNGAFYGFKNIEQLSVHSLEEDLQTFRNLKRRYPGKVILASIMGRNEEEWTTLAQAVTQAGADVIECNFSCPNMEEKGTGVDVGQQPEVVARYTAAVRRGTHLPILAKMTPNLADMRPAARAAIAAGANGIAAINTIKSITNVNPDTMTTAPSVRGRSSIGGYSGIAVKPIALRFMAELGGDPVIAGTHISGMGGIETWRDALEFLLLGASSIQVTTAVMQYGYRIIDDLCQGLRIFMAQHGYTSVSQLIGGAVDTVVDTDRLDRESIVYPRFHPERCVGCGRCYISCRDGGHQALTFDSEARRPTLMPGKCVGCHLCVLVCPAQAITGDGKRVPLREGKA